MPTKLRSTGAGAAEAAPTHVTLSATAILVNIRVFMAASLDYLT
jgi:hypothetical protein